MVKAITCLADLHSSIFKIFNTTRYSCFTLNLEAFVWLHLHFKGVTRIHKNFSLEPKKEAESEKKKAVFCLLVWRCCMFAHLHRVLQMLDVSRCTKFIGSHFFTSFFNVFLRKSRPSHLFCMSNWEWLFLLPKVVWNLHIFARNILELIWNTLNYFLQHIKSLEGIFKSRLIWNDLHCSAVVVLEHNHILFVREDKGIVTCCWVTHAALPGHTAQAAKKTCVGVFFLLNDRLLLLYWCFFSRLLQSSESFLPGTFF